jgi:hypothetical protein
MVRFICKCFPESILFFQGFGWQGSEVRLGRRFKSFARFRASGNRNGAVHGFG